MAPEPLLGAPFENRSKAIESPLGMKNALLTGKLLANLREDVWASADQVMSGTAEFRKQNNRKTDR